MAENITRRITALHKWFLFTIAFSMLSLILLWVLVGTKDGHQLQALGIDKAARAKMIKKLEEENMINPPKLTENEKSRLKKLLKSEVNKNYSAIQEMLSSIVQNQIEKIQRKNCTGPNFICGHFDRCGLGCQIHHRAACVMISYVLNMPLIHDEVTGWPHSKNWTHGFLPIGSQCSQGPSTYTWSWKKNQHYLNKSANNGASHKNQNITHEIPYPLANGLPVSDEMGYQIEKITRTPFHWWVGQFIKYTMRLSPNFETFMRKQKEHVGFKKTSPIVGIHVRRTDKLRESANSHHELYEYFTPAEKFFQAEEHKLGRKLERRIFVASDSVEVLPAAKFLYPLWDVRGFPSNKTLVAPAERVNAFDEILRVVLILSECDYVICGFDSNICSLLLEMLNWNREKPAGSLLSLEDNEHESIYSSYMLGGYKSIKSVIVKVY